jgi:hypothetical protein
LSNWKGFVLMGPPLWSKWSEFLATDPEARVRFPDTTRKEKVVVLERGPVSPVNTTEELLDRKVAASV